MTDSVEKIVSSYKSGRREDLIPILQKIQEAVGYIPEEAIVAIGNKLKISTTKIYGLATFYDQFRFFPQGKIHITICNGTTCYINGASDVIEAVREFVGTEPGDTSRDKLFSYEVTTCVGGCHSSPVILVNGEYHAPVTPESISEMLSKLRVVIENE